MGVKWNNVIKDMTRGTHPAVAFHKEEQRTRRENRKNYEEAVRRQNAERERRRKMSEQERED